MLFRALLTALCICSASALDVITTAKELAAVERSAKVHALLVLGTEEKAQEMSLEELAVKAYPSLVEIEKELEGFVTFGVVDIAPHRKDSIGNKWQLAKLPALVIYKDAPQENPYTGKMYRNSKVTDATILDNPRKFKKMLKQAIPKEYVQELEGDLATLTNFEKIVNEKVKNEETVALLISKQKHASPMYRALAAEFQDQGLSFVFLHKDEEGAKEIMETLKVQELPAMVALRSMTEHVVLAAEHTKTYHELKGFVEPFAVQKEGKQGGGRKGAEGSKFIRFFSGNDFDDLVLRSDVVWIIEFMDADRENKLTEEEWKKSLTELHRKAGVVAMGAVSCEKEAELCKRHGGPGVRIFPLGLTDDRKLTRGDILPQTFTTIDEAKDPAIATIPDLTIEIVSAADLNGFISTAREDRALPILLFTTAKHTPPMMKALVLSVPTQKVKLAVIHDADEDLKKQFLVKPSASTSLVCLVPTQANSEDPTAVPFGVVAYEKKKMGAFNYPNIMQFILQVLAQYPHPLTAEPESEDVDLSSLDEKAAQSLVPYLTKTNMDELCGGGKICAIGFFEDHIDTLKDTESRLAKWWKTFAHVAVQSKNNREPFHFMWINGKCQKDFAEAFGVGLFQMPTLAVYSPSKQRYATNVGLFDEENAASFLKSVLSGSTVTAPIGDVPELGEECSFDEIQEVAVGATEDDEDLDDMLSEIISDEKQQREELEKELKSEQKSSKKSKKKHKSKKKKSKKKKAGRDEL